MTWQTLGASTGTWAAQAPTSKTWAAQTTTVSPPAWGQMSSLLTTVDYGVDFRLEAEVAYPMRVSADRPVAIAEVQPEGRP
jgi:hypothetical protein